ncbi:hypothetical protein L6R53_28090 [Myxococcota bacterium]|nr:hypothetical protein [Myxococcota bacterium]
MRASLLASGVLLPLHLALGGCAGGMQGAWTGSCDMSDGQYGDEIFLDLWIASDLGRRIQGQARVTLPSEGVYDVDLHGEHTLDAALLTLTIPSQDGDLDLSFEGTRDADELEGRCELWVPGATAPVVGQGDLER